MSDERELIGLEAELTALVNRFSLEDGSGTPDHILAKYLLGALDLCNQVIAQRDLHFQVPSPVEPVVSPKLPELDPAAPPLFQFPDGARSPLEQCRVQKANLADTVRNQRAIIEDKSREVNELQEKVDNLSDELRHQKNGVKAYQDNEHHWMKKLDQAKDLADLKTRQHANLVQQNTRQRQIIENQREMLRLQREEFEAELRELKEARDED